MRPPAALGQRWGGGVGSPVGKGASAVLRSGVGSGWQC